MNNNIVVPDTIDPYLGYKALTLRPDGMLASPQRNTCWPVKERFEATCSAVTYKWNAVPGYDSWVERTEERVVVRTGSGAEIATNTMDVPAPPDIELPWGYGWAWVSERHTPADKACTCGIYAVEDIYAVGAYLRTDCVICQVALWGQVTLGERGARGQYAYPQKMLIPDHLADVAPLVADLYGIEDLAPLQVRHAPEWYPATRPPTTTPTTFAETEEFREAAKAAYHIFLTTYIALAFTTIALALTTDGWALATAIPSCVVMLLAVIAYRDSRA